MAVKFFARFNLHNSICAKPISVEVLKPFLHLPDAELGAMLEEIDAIQAARCARLLGAYPAQAAALRGKRTLFLGDSITSDNLGYRDSVTRAASLHAIDGSVSGGTTSMILASARDQIANSRPELVSVLIGSNDSVSLERTELHQVSPTEYERNLRQILSWARQCDAAILLFEIPPVLETRFERSFASQGKLQSNETVRAYNAILRRVAEEYGVTPVPTASLGEDEDMLEADGIHLSLRGQEALAGQWLIAAEKAIKNHKR